MSTSVIYETEKNVPPGLLLPLSSESIDHFRTENFVKPDLTAEDFIDYGAFVVAMAVFDAEDSDRISVMPVTADFENLYSAGYGPSLGTLGKYGGGLIQLQRQLGFYSGGYKPTKHELIDRFTWLAQYGARVGNADYTSFREAIEWGAMRNLLPQVETVYEVMGRDWATIFDIRKQLGVEIRNRKTHLTGRSLYKFGLEVLATHGRPLSADELSELYPDRFLGDTYETIRYHSGALNKFWQKFELISHSRGFTKEELISIGVQWRIAHNGQILSFDQIDTQSKLKKFPSRNPLNRRFQGLPNYWQKVDEGYQQYQELRQELSASGLPERVINVTLKNFDVSDAFTKATNNCNSSLQLLASNSGRAKWALGIVEHGFDMVNDDIFEIQLLDFCNYFIQHDASNEQLSFILGLVPLIDADETLVLFNQLQNKSIDQNYKNQ